MKIIRKTDNKCLTSFSICGRVLLNDEKRINSNECFTPYRDASVYWFGFHRSSSLELPIGFSFEATSLDTADETSDRMGIPTYGISSLIDKVNITVKGAGKDGNTSPHKCVQAGLKDASKRCRRCDDDEGRTLRTDSAKGEGRGHSRLWLLAWTDKGMGQVSERRYIYDK